MLGYINDFCTFVFTIEMVFANIRNAHDLNAWVEKTSALIAPEILLNLYNRAREIPYAFLWLKKQAPKEDLIHIGFNKAEVI